MKKKIISFILVLAMMLSLGNFEAFAVAEDYLTFTANTSSASVTLDYETGENIMYSTDGGESWAIYSQNTPIALSPEGASVKFRGDGITTSSTHHFSMNGAMLVSGSVSSLTDGFGVDDDVQLEEDCYAYMFMGCQSMMSAPKLVADSVPAGAYAHMFRECLYLETAPALPATNLSEACYEYMFEGCKSLKTVPALNATELAEDCYRDMFLDCEALTEAPSLPATVAQEGCYQEMFRECSGITAPAPINLTTLAPDCCRAMYESTSIVIYSASTTGYTRTWTIPSVASQSNWAYGMFDGTTTNTLLRTPALDATYYIKDLPKTPQTLSFASATVTRLMADGGFTNTLSGANTTVTYSINNTNTATINASTGAVTLVGVGSATITATAASDDTYEAATKTYVLNVIPPYVGMTVSSITKAFDTTPLVGTVTTTPNDAVVTYQAKQSVGAQWGSSSANAPSITNAGKLYVKATATKAGYTTNTLEYTLEVTKCPITIYSNSYNKIYDGTALANSVTGWTYDGNLPLGYSLNVGLTYTTRTLPGTDSNAFGNCMVINNLQMIDSNNFELTLSPGSITVNKIPIVIKSNSGSKTYDGNVLTNSGFTISGSSLMLQGDSIEVTVNGSQTEVGSSNNSFSYILNGNPTFYDIKCEYGKLTVNSAGGGGGGAAGGGAATPKTENKKEFINPFVDVSSDEEAIMWAYENGITNGVDETHFNPDGSVTRAQMVTFLWRVAGYSKSTAEVVFVDIDKNAYYIDGLKWAYEKGITNGIGANKFGPDGEVTKSQLVLFIERFSGKKIEFTEDGVCTRREIVQTLYDIKDN